MTPRILIAPDSFKGTLTARQAANALAAGLRQALPSATLIQCPLADGGEGTLASLQSVLTGTSNLVAVQNAVGRRQQAPVYCCEWNHQPTAVIEAATVVGLTEAALSQPVQARTTLGLGQLLKWSLDQNLSAIYVGLGGSCTNDGGAGLLVGLGAKLLNVAGGPVVPTPAGLAQLAAIDFSNLDRRIFERKLVLLTDVDSPLCGPKGATHTFGPQKGLVNRLERNQADQDLVHYAALAEQALRELMPSSDASRIQDRPGAGAAGGLGFALQLMGGTYTSGAQVIAEMLNLPQRLGETDWLITGEGRSDTQTLAGKAPWIAAQMAQARNVSITLLSGNLRLEDVEALRHAFKGPCFSLAPDPSCCFDALNAPKTVEDCITHAADWMTKAGFVLGQRWSQENAEDAGANRNRH